jgi:hypothetical protein
MVTMKFRAGLMIGMGVGYVLGARAGRERYEQIKRISSKTARHPAVSQILDQATGVSDLARNVVAGGLDSGARGLRSVAEPAEREAN